MRVLGEITHVRKMLAQVRAGTLRGRVHGVRRPSIGLVPTMGALHAGHLSLVEMACNEADFVVVLIFVNPTQFGPNEDFSRYPRPIEADLQACRGAGVDLVFNPEPDEMYLSGSCTFVEVAGLQNGLCGPSRPGHFRGVATVVLKLLNIIGPDFAYFGQKDAQQARIIQQLVRDLNVPTVIRVGSTVREADGLALSSRNRYLDPSQRGRATVLYRTLSEAVARIQAGDRDARALQRLLAERITATPGAVLDYAAVVDADTLETLTEVRGPTLLALAVRFGGTRLIDNMRVEP